MFDDGLTPECIPERIYAMICLVKNKKRILKNEAFELLEPIALNKNYGYSSIVLNAAIDLGLINKENECLFYVGNDNCVKSLNDFRKYCNSVLWNNENSLFYKMASAFIDSDYYFVNSNITDSSNISYIVKYTNNKNVDAKRILALRFWLSFLGFGYVFEAKIINFLPNMCVMLRDFIEISSIEKNKDYTIREFFEILSNKCGKICITPCMNEYRLSAAISNGLRTLHDNNEIVLKRILDSKEIWSLSKSDIHQLSNITHIMVKGVK